MQKSDINVLIVEDDASQRESLVAAVKKLGYKVVGVKKPEEAESIARLKSIHGLIVDCMLPGKSGVDLVASLKANIVDDAAVIFISGIYRDKTFQQEAVRKSDALQFYQKPFNIDEVMKTLDGHLTKFVEAPKVDLHALLAAPMASQRDRRKALDHVEEMYGYDLPFVFCILMESESSGYLNIIDDKQNIYGVTFAKGCISKVDSENTVIQTRKILIRHGFITEQELSELTDKKAPDLVKALVDEGLISPHVKGLIKSEQIMADLDRLVSGERLDINFVQDRKIKPDAEDLDMSSFLPQLQEMISKKIPVDYLKTFYKTWLGHPIRLGPNYQEQIQVLSLPVITKVAGLLEAIKKEPTLDDLFADTRFKSDDLYRALHLMAIRRILVFDETKRVKNLDEHVNRLKMIFGEINGKGPIEVFKFFGLGDNPKAKEVSQVYKEFAKSNHPDTLPQAISDDVRKLNHNLFSMVSDAHDILTDPKKKEDYFNKVKQGEAENQLKSEELLAEAYSNLSRGQFSSAVTIIQRALKLYDSEKARLYEKWALANSDALNAEAAKAEVEVLRKMSVQTRRSSLYAFVSGVLRRKMGANEEAKRDFEKALQIDSNFKDARRELASLKGATPQKVSVNDMLTGDITQVFSRVFKKKKGA